MPSFSPALAIMMLILFDKREHLMNKIDAILVIYVYLLFVI